MFYSYISLPKSANDYRSETLLSAVLWKATLTMNNFVDYVHVTSSQQSAMLLYSTLRLYKKQLEPHCHNIYIRV